MTDRNCLDLGGLRNPTDENPSGAWIQTYTGKRFYPLAPRVEDIDIVDIAHALSMTCRYGGMCRTFYSVAEHSVLVAIKAPKHLRLRALLHDAPEVYSPFGDVAAPVKRDPMVGRTVAQIEAPIEQAIALKFGLPYPIVNDEIGKLDKRILHDERAALMGPCRHDWGLDGEPLGVTILGLEPRAAEKYFIQAYCQFAGDALLAGAAVDDALPR